MENNKTWYSVELNADNAYRFMDYLRTKGINFEPSECYNLIHFECYMTNDERKDANDHLQNVIFAN